MGRGPNDGLNVPELGEDADKWERGSEEGSEVGKAGWEKSGLRTLSSSSHGLGEEERAGLRIWGSTELPSKSASSSFEHLLCARFVYTTS